jgi:hypothetical protein
MWRTGWDLNPRFTVLQTVALPLGYPSDGVFSFNVEDADRHNHSIRGVQPLRIAWYNAYRYDLIPRKILLFEESYKRSNMLRSLKIRLFI